MTSRATITAIFYPWEICPSAKSCHIRSVLTGQRWVAFYDLEFLTLTKFNFSLKESRNLDDQTEEWGNGTMTASGRPKAKP